MNVPFLEDNDQIGARRDQLGKLRELVGNVYPNKFDFSSATGATDTISAVVNSTAIQNLVPPTADGEKPSDEQREAANAELNKYQIRLAGRLAVPPRVMGKAAFVHLSDGVSRIQIYLKKDDFSVVTFNDSNPNGWEIVGLLSHGDFVGVAGYLFITKTGELSIHVETLQFLAKALSPMPDKMHGIEDAEVKQRRRYADLIASSLKLDFEPGELTTREVFERRARLISGMRKYLDEHGYIEVETPMLTPKATGAAAKPFATHHNALDIPLFARIAPELYLKRLLVGGFEKVYELNRNFRNEGISTRHNPEFTMLEFYCAYMDVVGMMDFAEKMIQESVEKATGVLQIQYGENAIDFGKFERVSMSDAIRKFAPDVKFTNENMLEKFEQHAEAHLIQPTFIVDFPKSKSPLSKASPENAEIAERFELYINGMECANGFSELNDPQEQYERFLDQVRERDKGDDEAMELDEDYIRALSYGMPPAAGIGIGIDRLVMLLTNRHSIRDVILFPHLRPEKPQHEEQINQSK